jgi:threonylcarbamoyladenosine tRNA methylthiotransferase CDKAL1
MVDEAGTLAGIRDIAVCVKTFGCTYNAGDSRKLIEVLKSQGCTIVDSPHLAGAVVVNTCTVIAPTERKVLTYLAGVKAHRLYVTGCMPAVQMPDIRSVCAPEVIEPEEIQSLYRQVGTVPAGSVGIVQIAQGCMGRCSYCITRRARGRLRSVPLEHILTQVRQLVATGAVEIQLTAQDVGVWGADLHTDLPTLLNAVARIPGMFRVRVGMMNPSGVTGYLDRLVRAYRDEKIFTFMHLPLQSGSDHILTDMKRGYTTDEFFFIIDAFRAEFPDISIATDMIAGFPGETPDDFAASVRAIERLRPGKVNITRYSRRPSCGSGEMYDFPDFVKKNRSRYLNSVSDRMYRLVNASWIGRIVPVIVTEQIRNGSVISRTPCYRNVVIQATLPPGYSGHALLREDRLHYFIGELVDAPDR